MSQSPKPGFKTKYPKVFWTFVTLIVVYIAGIGIPAIEELKARTDATASLDAREAEVLRELSNGEAIGPEQKSALQQERTFLRGLQRELVALTLGSAVERSDGKVAAGTLDEILCRWTAYPAVNPTCSKHQHTKLSRFFLAARSQEAASGAVLAVLIVTAAFGGALVRLSLPSVKEEHSSDILQPLLRAVGGGIVCYLVIRGNGIPGAIADVSSYSNPATASLAGFLSGMFSQHVFELLTDLVEALVNKVRPDRKNEKLAKVGAVPGGGGAEAGAGRPLPAGDVPKPMFVSPG